MIFRNSVILRPDSTILSGYDLKVINGEIVEIGVRIQNNEQDQEVDLCGKLIFPGMINAHTHLGETVFRGFCDDMSLKQYIHKSHSTFDSLFNKDNDERIHSVSSLLTLSELAQSGTTTICASRGWNELKKIGMRGFCGIPLINIGKTAKYYNGFIEGVIETNWQDDSVKPIIYVQSIMSIEEDVLKSLAEYIRENNSKYYIHLSETIEENKWCMDKYGMTPVQYLNKLGILKEYAILVHCVHLCDEDYDLIERSNCSVVLCPVSNLKLNSGIANINRFLAMKIRLGLGTDGLATNNGASILETAKLLLLLSSKKKEYVTRTLQILTTEAAAIFGLQDKIGDIAIGYSADLAIFDCNQYLLEDIDTLASNFIFNQTAFKVSQVYVKGKKINISSDFLAEVGKDFLKLRKQVFDNQ